MLGALYGITLSLYVLTMNFLFLDKRPNRRVRMLFYSTFTTTMMIFGTIYMSFCSRLAVSNYNATLKEIGWTGKELPYTTADDIVSSACWALITAMADGLLVSPTLCNR